MPACTHTHTHDFVQYAATKKKKKGGGRHSQKEGQEVVVSCWVFFWWLLFFVIMCKIKVCLTNLYFFILVSCMIRLLFVGLFNMSKAATFIHSQNMLLWLKKEETKKAHAAETLNWNKVRNKVKQNNKKGSSSLRECWFLEQNISFKPASLFKNKSAYRISKRW